MTATETETEPVKIKIQKRTATERQKEALEKARKEKQKKKILKESQSDFFLPPTYLVATSILGLSALGAYYYLKQPTSYQDIQQNFKEQVVQMEPIVHQVSQQVQETYQQQVKPTMTKAQIRMKEMLEGSTII